MIPPDTPSTQAIARVQGDRHLRLVVEVDAKGLRLASMDVVDEPVILPPTAAGPWFARVARDDSAITLQSFPDPRYGEGIGRPDNPMHSRQVLQKGLVTIRVPLAAGQPLPKIDVKVFNASRSARPLTPDTMKGLTRSTRWGVKLFGSLDDSALREHPDWQRVAPAFGDTVAPDRGYFEIYQDKNERYRWRLRRPGGVIVASSGQVYANREDCEKDLRWIKEHAQSTIVRSLDLPS